VPGRRTAAAGFAVHHSREQADGTINRIAKQQQATKHMAKQQQVTSGCS
jgi:hypothetical protein